MLKTRKNRSLVDLFARNERYEALGCESFSLSVVEGSNRERRNLLPRFSKPIESSIRGTMIDTFPRSFISEEKEWYIARNISRDLRLNPRESREIPLVERPDARHRAVNETFEHFEDGN